MTTSNQHQSGNVLRTDSLPYTELTGIGSIGCIVLAGILRFSFARQYHNAIGDAHRGSKLTSFHMDDVTRWYEITTPLLVLGCVLALLSVALIVSKRPSQSAT